MLAFDLETHLIQPGLLAPPIVCGSFRMAGGPWLLDRASTLVQVESFLNSDKLEWAGANIAYDFGCILAACPQLLPNIWRAYEEGRVYDVIIGATLDALYHGRMQDGELFSVAGSKIQSGRYSLETVTADYLLRTDAKKNDVWRKSYAALEGTPIEQWPAEARQYPLDDVNNTYEAAHVLKFVGRNQHDQPRQVHAAFCAHLGAIWGLHIDAEAVSKVKESVDVQIDIAREYAYSKGLMKQGGTRKAPKLTKNMAAIKDLVSKAYGGSPPTTPTRGTSTSRETLEDSGDPTLEKFAEGSKWEKLRTYADTLSALGTCPMNVSCNILVSTGRASYDGLIQLMPRKGGIRECIMAREGHVIISVDYNAIEMSTLAQVQLWALGRSKLAEKINAGLDPHSAFAAEMTGVEYPDFLAHKERSYEAGMRQAAKAANFGFPGMMGPAKFVIAKKREGESVCSWLAGFGKCGEQKVRSFKGRDLDAPLCLACLEAADKLRASYLEQWPEMRPYWKWIGAQLDTAEGRLEQFVSQRVRGGLSAPAAANTLFQGLAADGAKAALVKLTQEMYLDRSSPLFGSRLLVFAHDETLLEVPEEHMHEAGYRQAEIMISEMRKFVPDVKVGAEPAAMRRWSKACKTAKDKDGKLAVWER